MLQTEYKTQGLLYSASIRTCGKKSKVAQTLKKNIKDGVRRFLDLKKLVKEHAEYQKIILGQSRSLVVDNAD